jgi:threonine synthase
MGLPVKKFVAATNINDIVPRYLDSGTFSPRPSTQTISNAMDVGDPSNFARILDLFSGDRVGIAGQVVGYAFDDDATRKAMQRIYASTGYVMDPHGAVGYLGLTRYLEKTREDVTGVFLETAHPAKFKEVVDETLGQSVPVPSALDKFLRGEKQASPMARDYSDFEHYLLNQF